MQDFLTVEQAAKLAGMAEISVYSRIRRKTLPAVRIHQRCLLIRRSDVERMIADRAAKGLVR